MARELITRVWCDMCLGEDEAREEATHSDEVRVGGGPTKPRMLETCERHYKDVVEPLVTALFQWGAIVPDAGSPAPMTRKRSSLPQADGPVECKMPGCTSGPLANHSSFARHLRNMHSSNVKEYRAMYGQPTPAAAEPTLLDEDGDSEAPQRVATLEMPLRHIPDQGVKMWCPFEGCTLAKPNQPSKNKRALSAHFSQRHEVPIGQWFRENPEVTPDSLVAEEGWGT